MSREDHAANIAASSFAQIGDGSEANAANTVSGACAITASSARAGPRGMRLPCSQFLMVSTGTPSRAANSIWVRRAPAKLANRRGRCRLCGCNERHRWRQRKLPSIPQFDDPSVRFQPQSLHVQLQAGMVGDAR